MLRTDFFLVFELEMYRTKSCFQLYIPTLLISYSNLWTMIHTLNLKCTYYITQIHQNFAECKVVVTKIVSLLWVLADIDLQK